MGRLKTYKENEFSSTFSNKYILKKSVSKTEELEIKAKILNGTLKDFLKWCKGWCYKIFKLTHINSD